MFWIIILIIIVLVLSKFTGDYLLRKQNNINAGGLSNMIPAWKEYFEKEGFIFIKDTGTVLEYHKLFYSDSLKENCDLHLILESVFVHILSGYILTESGKKIKSIKIEFGGKGNLENSDNIETIIRQIMAGFESQGVFN